MLNIGGLNQGVVIDHIKAGHAMQIYHYLNLEKLDCSVAIIKNAKSNKMGKKDIIKVECPIDALDLDILGFIDHNITVNIIQNDEIVEKKELHLPKQIVNVINCKNPRCITSIEQELDQIFILTVTNIIKCKNPRCITSIEQELPHRFKLTDRKHRIYRCLYCEQKFKPAQEKEF